MCQMRYKVVSNCRFETRKNKYEDKAHENRRSLINLSLPPAWQSEQIERYNFEAGRRTIKSKNLYMVYTGEN